MVESGKLTDIDCKVMSFPYTLENGESAAAAEIKSLVELLCEGETPSLHTVF